jgi:hypothetical protein
MLQVGMFYPYTPYTLRDVLKMAIALMMEAANTSETSINVYQTTRRNNPEDSHLHARRRGNLKFHLRDVLFLWDTLPKNFLM